MAVGVVVPARNEAKRLPACLDALIDASAQVAVGTHIVVVLDACTDDSLQVIHRFQDVVAAHAPRCWLDFAEVSVRNVGAARAAGMAALLAHRDLAPWWLATTDADSVVPPRWLASFLERARHGFDAVLGTIAIRSDAYHNYSDTVLTRARTDYESPAPSSASGTAVAGTADDAHRHVHGANLGMRTDAYLAAGGFLPLAEHEDVALVEALSTLGRRLAWVEDIPVLTSARRDGRTPGGLARYLRELEPHDSLVAAKRPAHTPDWQCPTHGAVNPVELAPAAGATTPAAGRGVTRRQA